MRQVESSESTDELDAELNAARRALANIAPAEVLDRLILAAMQTGARRIVEALDAEGRIEPCGQGCGWEGPWSVDSTLWPADRERLLGEGYHSPAEVAEIEERRRLLPRRGDGHAP